MESKENRKENASRRWIEVTRWKSRLVIRQG